MANFFPVVSGGQSVTSSKTKNLQIRLPVTENRTLSATAWVAQLIYVPEGSTVLPITVLTSEWVDKDVVISQCDYGAERWFSYDIYKNGTYIKRNTICLYPYLPSNGTLKLRETCVAYATVPYVDNPQTNYGLDSFDPLDPTYVVKTAILSYAQQKLRLECTNLQPGSLYWLVIDPNQIPLSYTLTESTIYELELAVYGDILGLVQSEHPEDPSAWAISNVKIVRGVAFSRDNLIVDYTDVSAVVTGGNKTKFTVTDSWTPYGGATTVLYNNQAYYAVRLDSTGYPVETYPATISRHAYGNSPIFAQLIGSTWEFNQTDSLVLYVDTRPEFDTQVSLSLDGSTWSTPKYVVTDLIANKIYDLPIDITDESLGGNNSSEIKTIYIKFSRLDRDELGGSSDFSIQRSVVFLEGTDPVVTAVRIKYLTNA